MAPEATAEAPQAPAGADSISLASPKKSGKLVKLVGVIALLIAAEAVITYLLMPSNSAPAKPDEAAAGTEPTPDRNDGPDQDTAEVAMGDFNCTNSKAAPGVVVHIDFKLTAITSPKQSSAFDAAVKSHQARVRQAISKIVRSSSLEDLNDPNLSTIKRLIRDEVNRLLRKTYILEVVISDVRTVEQ